jgi:TonB-dependent receptor
VDEDYDNMLPSLDFDIGISDNLKGRFSFGKSISRAGYADLTAEVSGFGTVGSTFNGAQPTANASNPSLVPLESDNLDIALEWYYGESSYASAGLFEKRVSNFIGREQVVTNWFGIQDQTNGPRAEAAAAALDGIGVLVDDTSLFVMMAILDNPADFPGGAADFQTDPATGDTTTLPAFAVSVATAYDLVPEAGDPLMDFSTTTPINNREASFSGAEFAVQHFFGDTGFGVLANYTVVNSDTSFDNLGLPSVSQFALTGLSDTANLVAIFENFGFSARLAYNWRDAFLAGTNRGNSRNPTYVDEYTQIDLNLAYDVSDALSVFFEGINITEENNRQYARSERQLWFLEDLGARYHLGARYTFQ